MRTRNLQLNLPQQQPTERCCYQCQQPTQYFLCNECSERERELSRQPLPFR